jgi:hypothetical protein
MSHESTSWSVSKATAAAIPSQRYRPLLPRSDRIVDRLTSAGRGRRSLFVTANNQIVAATAATSGANPATVANPITLASRIAIAQ